MFLSGQRWRFSFASKTATFLSIRHLLSTCCFVCLPLPEPRTSCTARLKSHSRPQAPKHHTPALAPVLWQGIEEDKKEEGE